MRRLALATGLALAWAIACGSDDEPASSGPTTPPTLAISKLAPAGGSAWTPGSGGCVELGQDGAGTVAVIVKVSSDFALRPPGLCGGSRRCGRVRLRIDPQGESEAARIEAAQSALSAPLLELGAGEHTFLVELLNDDGSPVVVKVDGVDSVVSDSVTLDVTEPGQCTAESDAGTEAGSDAATDAAGDAADDAASDGGADANDSATDAGQDAPSLDASAEAGADATSDAPGDG